MDHNGNPRLSQRKPAEPLPVDPDERWDWEFDIGERPPPSRTGKVWVQLRYRKAEPLPLPDPDED
jgi:hypothetical protein